MSNQNPGKKNNSAIVPSRGSGSQLGQRSPTYLANNLDRMFEDFRTSFNQLMTPFVTSSPWHADAFFAPLSLLPELTEAEAHAHQARFPVIDVVDEGDYYTVTAELPGFNRENVDIQVGDDGTLQLSAQVQSEHKGGRYMSHERSYSAFQRTIQFPEQVVANKVEGTMKDGVLSLRIPKKEPTSTKFTKVALK
jgi:HSP20 family molecular chaperone IbpA